MRKELKPRDHSLILKAFRSYLQFVNSGLYFRKEHILGIEKVPMNGTPLVIVSNHQNCLNDPLSVAMNLTDRRMNFIARANVFKNPIAGKFLRKLGLLPAYRMSHEGYSAINKNRETFDAAGQALCDGETVMLFPEADHQDKRWLGNFKIGYLRIAFEAAEKFNFERDVMVLPSCNHYSNYFHARTDMMIRFGEPISLMPYYEEYQAQPRETMAKINTLVRNTIQQVVGENIPLFDGGVGTAKETRRRLEEANLLNDTAREGHITFENSANSPTMLSLCRRLLTEVAI